MTSHSMDPAERISEVRRFGEPMTPTEQRAATELLTDLVAAAQRHGLTLGDFDAVTDLPGACVDVVRART